MIAPCLKPGGTIGVCSPSHIARREEYRELLDALRGLGFRVKEADNLYSDAYGYGAPPEARAADFNQLIRDPEVELVMFGGGEGGNELLPLIDFDEIRRQPKRLLSYSDSTTILGAVWALTGLEVYYGQSPGHFRGISDYNLRNFRAFLMGDAPEHIASGPWRVQTGGVGEGVLAGGYARNFAMMIGSRYYPVDLNRKYVLFIEDHEKFGGVDYVSAMLSHIEQTDFVRSVTGLLFGHYSTADHPELQARIRRFGERWGIPAVCCDDFGHGENHAVLRVGHRVRLDADHGTLRYL